MGEKPAFSIGPGEAARISTGGMLPDGADGVVMVEHAEMIDDLTLEVYTRVWRRASTWWPGARISGKAMSWYPGGPLIRPQEAGHAGRFRYQSGICL